MSLFVWDWSGFLLFQLYIIVSAIHGNKGFVADVAVILLCFPFAMFWLHIMKPEAYTLEVFTKKGLELQARRNG